MNRTPTCPFFVGLHRSLPGSNASSPVKAVVSETTTTARSLRDSGPGVDGEPVVQNKRKNKRRMTRQNNVEEVEEIFTFVESPPPSKRRKSTRDISQSNRIESSPQTLRSEDVVKDKTESKRRSRRTTTNPKPRKSTAV